MRCFSSVYCTKSMSDVTVVSGNTRKGTPTMANASAQSGIIVKYQVTGPHSGEMLFLNNPKAEQ